jgi:hypothetical protein
MYCLEYSKKQNAFHVQSLKNSIYSNNKQFKRHIKQDGFMSDYIIIALNKNREKLSKICYKYQKARNKKENISELKKMPYKEYLKTNHWLNLKEKIHEKYYDQCVECGSAERLQVHHKTYIRRGHEKLKDLILLCEKCHSKEHFKD